MSITAKVAATNVPRQIDIEIWTGSASGIINVGDHLAYSGQAVVPTYAGGLAYWKASAAGVAMESNPQYDAHGRVVSASALKFVRQGVLRVSAAFSGLPTLGLGAYPVGTGSGLAAPTGMTGKAAIWQTGVKLPASGSTGAGGSGVALVVGVDMSRANAGTGELDILLSMPRPDYY